jgi:hypothetical protein
MNLIQHGEVYVPTEDDKVYGHLVTAAAQAEIPSKFAFSCQKLCFCLVIVLFNVLMY